jgi:threonine dehydrogenase-like Zn-dependent dehydrogenase
VPERLRMAAEQGKAEVINFEKVKVYDALQEMTGGRGPDSCIDAVGAEAHGSGSFDAILDKAKAAVMLATDRLHVLREIIMCCRKGGTLSVPGVYLGFLDKVPFGAYVGKGLTMRTGQTHAQRYLQPLLERIEKGEIDPSFVVTHRLPLNEAPQAYEAFRDKKDGCIKVVLTP